MARHVYRCPLRWGDMDAYGHVNNVVYLQYLEEARVDLMFRLGELQGGAAFGAGSVVARHEIDYLRPMGHGYEPVIIETWVTKTAAASITVAYEIKDAEQVYARASTVIVPYDLEHGRVRRLSPAEREFLDRWRDEPDVPPVEPGKPGTPGAGTSEGAVAV